ncbi:MAG: hypothetical protein LBG96_01550 [Tannerella sp.]|jgi:site-specific DNA-methyltransferase (adenine-specific)|nr:hypothetical protein [Tannerella sp.]
MGRLLLEQGCNTFIRFNDAIRIFRNINGKHEKSFESLVSSRKPFGFDSKIKVAEKEFANSVKIYSYPKNGFVSKKKISKNISWVTKNKVMIAKAYGERGGLPYLVLGKPFVGEIGNCCSETYLVIGQFNTEKEAQNVKSYIHTKVFRFLVLLKKNTQNAPKDVYSFVPMQDFSEPWTDEKRYKKYGSTQDEITFIESMIRPMEVEVGK